MNTIEQVAIPAVSTDSLSEVAVGKLLELALLKDEKSEELKAINEAFKASLPIATAEQVNALVMLHRNEFEIPDGLKADQDFRLTTEHKDQIKAAKEERAVELDSKKDQILDAIKVEGSRFTSYRVKVSPKQTTKTLKFVKKHDGKGSASGLIAALRAERNEA